jgi:predicted dienelactone hydrolase
MTALRHPFARRRAALGAAVAAAVTAASAVGLPALADGGADTGPPATFRLPEPTGPHDVGNLDLHLVDADRPDPLADGEPRELMASVWYPAEHRRGKPATPYLSDGVARIYDQTSGHMGIDPGEVDFAGARTHAQTRAPVADGLTGAPVVVYSPGGGSPRFLGTTLVEELASHGFVVVTVDHPHQAPVEYPDRMTMPAPDPDMAAMLADRADDLSFVIDTIEELAAGAEPDAEGRPLPDGLAGALDPERVGVFGHSMGGFATAEAMLDDPRIDVGADLDGSMSPKYGRASQEGVDRPFLLMGGGENGDEGQPHHHLTTPEWNDFWANSPGWKRDLYLADAEHMSFTDFQAVFPQIRRPAGMDPEAVEGAIGTISPMRSVAVQRTYVTALFDHHLRGGPGDPFDTPSRYPQAEFID